MDFIVGFCLGLPSRFALPYAQALPEQVAFKPLKHPVRFEKFWGDYSKSSITAKLGLKAPPELIEYIRQDNVANGWSQVPKAADVSKDFVADIKGAVSEIPDEVATAVNMKLSGVFLVSDLGGSGYTEYVLDEHGHPSAGFVVLDVGAVDRVANEWATWKESSPFNLNDGTKIEAVIETAKNNNRKNAIQYILLHEFGHVVSIGSPLLPAWGVNPSTQKVTGAMRFFNLSWLIKGDLYLSKFDPDWPARAKIRYYTDRQNQLKGVDALDQYDRLQKTNFPTLYAATHPGEDFAESFASFVHVVLQKKPWEIRISQMKSSSKATSSEVSTFKFGSCWSDLRCQEKGALIEALLAAKL